MSKHAARRSSSDYGLAREDAFDVPAAVLCTICGASDCAGCSPKDEESGVVAIIPWERPGAGVMSRLFATAKASTVGAEAFFSALPDGEINPAVQFAVLAEVLAVASMAAILVPIAALVLPKLALSIVLDAAARKTAAHVALFGVPGLALWMVAAHVTHGAALDRGARKQGAPSQRRRAVRFGLYACGWDLMTGPLGAVATLFSTGVRATVNLLDAAMHAPSTSSVAFLQGVYRLAPEALVKARRSGTLAAVAIAILTGLAFLALVTIAALSSL